MSEREALRFAARRASLLRAVRDGDAVVAARAAARLRVDGRMASAADFALARRARRVLGRAIVNARLDRRREPPLRHEAAITASAEAARRWPYAAAALAAALVLYVLLPGGSGPGSSAPAGQPSPAAAQPQTRAVPLTVSRGRTITLNDEVAAAESPTPAPTAAATEAPTAAPTAAPSRTSGSGSGRTTPPGLGGGGSGGGGGIVPKPTPTPTPVPVTTPPVPPPGFGRFNIIVYDASTGRPVPGVCVIVGSQVCGYASYTDGSGRWSADIPVTAGATYWDVRFVRDGYLTQTRRLQLAAGRTVTYQVFLRRF